MYKPYIGQFYIFFNELTMVPMVRESGSRNGEVPWWGQRHARQNANVGKCWEKNYVLFFSAFPRPDGAVTSLPGIADLSASTADLSGCVVREVGSRSTGRCRGGVRGTPVRTQKWKNVGKIDVPFSPRIFPP